MVNQLLNPKTIEKNKRDKLTQHEKKRYLLRPLLFIIAFCISYLLYAERAITIQPSINSLAVDTIPTKKDTVPKEDVMLPPVDTAKSGKQDTIPQAANKPVVSDTVPTGPADSVRGIVRDEKGKPVAGAAITIKGKEMSFAADSEGRYSVAVAPGTVLIISAVGHRSQELLVSSEKKVYDAVLVEEATSLEEVVVTALGIERSAKDLVYATQTVKTAELTGIRDPSNVINSLQGKVANAVITQGSGGPGSGARMVLRGNRSIQGANTALIVIDGVPMANPTYTTPGNTFGGIQGPDGASNINPDDIESVTILRGASAAALYGSQAGNGVMVITTKKGKKGKYEVNFNSGLTFEQPFALPMVQNKYGQGLGGKMDPTIGDSWGALMSGQTYTNLQGVQSKYSAQPNNIRDFFQTGTSFNNSISISGGSDKMQTYFSYTNNSQTGIVPENKLGRHTFNLRLNNKITDRLSSDVKMTYITQDIKNMPRTGEQNAPVMDIYQIPRNTSIEEIRNYQVLDSSGIMVPTPWPSTLASIYQNPYWMVHNTAVDVGRDRIMGFVSLKYDLTDWLHVAARANLDQIKDDMEQRYAEGSILYTNAGAGGNLILTNTETTQKWYDLIFSGKNNISEDWKIDYNFGAIYSDVIGRSNNVQANGLNLVNAFRINFAKNPINTASVSGTTTQSLFGQATVGFKDAIFIDASYRNDWDSRLPAPYSYGYYSAGTSVIFSDLFKLPKSINFLKGFVSYAEVGNGGREQIRQVTYNYTQGIGSGKIARTATYPIENLKPEIVKNWEGGAEIRFLENRLGFAATVYINRLVI